jgi:hypothetical protein
MSSEFYGRHNGGLFPHPLGGASVFVFREEEIFICHLLPDADLRSSKCVQNSLRN